MPWDGLGWLPTNPEYPAAHKRRLSCGSGSGSDAIPVRFFMFSGSLFVVRWSRVDSVPVVAWRAAQAPRRRGRWVWSVSCSKKFVEVGSWLIGTLIPPSSVWGMFFWATVAGSPVNFRGTRGSSLELAGSVDVSVRFGSVRFGSVRSGSQVSFRWVVAVKVNVGGAPASGSDSNAQPLGSISTDKGRCPTGAFA